MLKIFLDHGVRLPLFTLLILGAGARAASQAPSIDVADAPNCEAMGLKHCPLPLDRELPAAADILTWTQDDRVIGFRNSYRQYAGDVFHADPAQKFALKAPPAGFYPHYQLGTEPSTLEDYLKRQSV